MRRDMTMRQLIVGMIGIAKRMVDRHLLPIAIAAGFLCVAGAAVAEMSHHHGAESDPKCTDTSLACATQVTPTFAADGTLWLAWAANRVVSVAHSSDLGRTFSTPVAVNSEPLDLDWGPDSRPNIIVDNDGRVFVAFARFRIRNSTAKHSIHARPMAGAASQHPLRSPPIRRANAFKRSPSIRTARCLRPEK